MQEVETVAEHCKHEDCIYRGRLHACGIPICQFILVEGESRKCPISECNRYKPGEKVQPRMLDDYTIMWEYEVYGNADIVWQGLIETDI